METEFDKFKKDFELWSGFQFKATTLTNAIIEIQAIKISLYNEINEQAEKLEGRVKNIFNKGVHYK